MWVRTEEIAARRRRGERHRMTSACARFKRQGFVARQRRGDGADLDRFYDTSCTCPPGPCALRRGSITASRPSCADQPRAGDPWLEERCYSIAVGTSLGLATQGARTFGVGRASWRWIWLQWINADACHGSPTLPAGLVTVRLGVWPRGAGRARLLRPRVCRSHCRTTTALPRHYPAASRCSRMELRGATAKMWSLQPRPISASGACPEQRLAAAAS